MRILAIIPARSGSKGLPGKNIKPLGGVPLMGYTIKAAVDSGCFAKVMVSTDSHEYAQIAMEQGAEVPFLRSNLNSGDHASSWDMVREVLDEYSKLSEEFDAICLLQPTSPLRTAQDICGAVAMMGDKGADAIVSVCPAEHSPLLCNTLDSEGSLHGFIDKEGMKRRQDQGEFYRLNGAIYLVKVDIVLEGDDIYGPKSYAYIMDKTHSVDIDDAMDFAYAEVILPFSLKKEKGSEKEN